MIPPASVGGRVQVSFAVVVSLLSVVVPKISLSWCESLFLSSWQLRPLEVFRASRFFFSCGPGCSRTLGGWPPPVALSGRAHIDGVTCFRAHGRAYGRVGSR